MEKIGESYLSQFKNFLGNTMLPLMGIGKVADNIIPIQEPSSTLLDDQKQGALRFGDGNYLFFEVGLKQKIDESLISLGRKILGFFWSQSQFTLDGSVKRKYLSDISREEVYRYCAQKAIADIISPNGSNIERLFSILEEWSQKTYEGKGVPFCIIVNPNAMPNHDTAFGDFLTFLKDEYAAVLSDCVSSAFEVDSECRFSRMVSTFSDSKIMPAKLNEGSPYRFANVIGHYAVDGATAILLLVNGDILVCQNGAVLFVKRNGKWLNFSFSAFKNSFLASEYRQKVDLKLLKAIFSSCIDVSFSHCGGIIALIKDKQYLTHKDPDSLPILSLFDDVSNSIPSSSLAERWQKEHDGNKEFKFKEEEMKNGF